MAKLDDDRMRAIAAASDGGWQISPRGRDVIFHKGAKQVTAKFDNDYALVLWKANGSDGRNGITGLLNALRA